MGQGMASRLLETGHQLNLYNRTASRAEALVRRGAQSFGSPKDACQGVDAVISMVADDAASRAIWFERDAAIINETATTVAQNVIIGKTSGRSSAYRPQNTGSSFWQRWKCRLLLADRSRSTKAPANATRTVITTHRARSIRTAECGPYLPSNLPSVCEILWGRDADAGHRPHRAAVGQKRYFVL